MLLASPQAGKRPLLREVTGFMVRGLPLIRTTSGGGAKDWKTPAMALPRRAAERVKLKVVLLVSIPSLDQRCSILPAPGSSVAMALLPPTNSLKRIFLSGSQPSHVAEAFISFVRFLASPPSLPMV